MIVIRSSGARVGWGQVGCCGPLTCQQGALRLMRRGLARRRRSGSGSSRISLIACSCAALRLWGGKSRVGAGAAAGGAQAAGERQSVGVKVGFEGGVVHQAADRVVGAEVAVGLLEDTVGVF